MSRHEDCTPWASIAEFHREVARRSEGAFFSLSESDVAGERWSFLDPFEPGDLAGPWEITPSDSMQAALRWATRSGPDIDLYLGGPCVQWRDLHGGRIYKPVIYRQVQLKASSSEQWSLVPLEGGWSLSPVLVDQWSRFEETALPEDLDAVVAGAVEWASSRYEEGEARRTSLAVAEYIASHCTALKRDLGRFANDGAWVLFSPPPQIAVRYARHLIADYDLLAERLQAYPDDPGGLRLLEGPRRSVAVEDVPTLPVVPLDDSQRAAVQGMLSGKPVTVVSGPPGCGKSQVVVSLLLNCWAAGKTVLFASNNNQAVNVVRERVAHFEDDFPIVVRAGTREHNNVQSVLWRVLLAIEGKERLHDSRRAREEHRARRLAERRELKQLLESQRPERLKEAWQAALKAYGEHHELLRRRADDRQMLTTRTRRLGYELPLVSLESEVVEPLAPWLEAGEALRHQLQAWAAERAAVTARLEAAEASRDASLRAMGLSESAGDSLSWLLQEPGPDSFRDWRRQFEELLAEPLEVVLDEFEWREEYEQWESAADAERWRKRAVSFWAETPGDLERYRRRYVTVENARREKQDAATAFEERAGVCPGPVRTEVLLEWTRCHAEMSLRPQRILDRLPLSRRSRLLRRMRKLALDLYMELPLKVRSEVGPLDAEGNQRFAGIVELATRWGRASESLQALSEDIDKLEEQSRILTQRARTVSAMPPPELADEAAWVDYLSSLQARIDLAAEASQAWSRRERYDETCTRIAEVVRKLGRIGVGLPAKEAWHKTDGGISLTGHLAALSDRPGLQDLGAARAWLHDGAWNDWLEAWEAARRHQRDVLSIRAEFAKLPDPEVAILEWQRLRPTAINGDVVPTHEPPEHGHPIHEHLDGLQGILQDWRKHDDFWQKDGQTQASAAMERARNQLAEATAILRDIAPGADFRHIDDDATDWPIEELQREVVARVPDGIHAKIARIDRDLERASFGEAKDRWLGRIAEDPEIERAIDRLQRGITGGRPITPARFEDFRKALAALPIWVTSAMSAQAIPMESQLFDLVVVDEATQCTLTNLLPMIYRAKALAVIGDPEQLPSINGISDQEQRNLAKRFGIEGWMGEFGHVQNDLYEVAVRQLRSRRDVRALTEHYRSHPQIIGFSNRHVYQRRLRLRTPESPRGGADEGGVFSVGVPGKAERGPNGRSWQNVREARQVVELVTKLHADASDQRIAVVTPFAAQVRLITSLLERQGTDVGTAVATVHKFQGDEREFVIFSPVASSGLPATSAKWIEEPHNLVNVAVTRARHAFYFVGDLEYCSKMKGILGKLAKYIQTVEELRATSPAELSLYTLMIAEGWRPRAHVSVVDMEVDLVLVEEGRKLAIEVDGEAYHQQPTVDRGRDAALRTHGFEVLRVPARDIHETPMTVIERIRQWLAEVHGTFPESITEDEWDAPFRSTGAIHGEAFDGDLYPDDWRSALARIDTRDGCKVLPGTDLVLNGEIVGATVCELVVGEKTFEIVDESKAPESAGDLGQPEGAEWIISTPSGLKAFVERAVKEASM